VEGVILPRWSKVTIALATAVTLALAGCGSGHKKSTSNTSSSGGKLDCKSVKGSGPKVGLAYDVGGQGDHSFNDSAVVGMRKAVKNLKATCTSGEAQDGEPESAREDRLKSMAEAGDNPVIGVGFSYSNAVNAVAPLYPKVSFAVIDGFDPDKKANPNAAYLDFAENEGSFLVGVAAAKKSKAHHIGFVGGVHIDLIKKFQAGYEAGARAVDPTIKIDVKYIEESNIKGFNDPAGGKAAAAGIYDKGADVVFQVAGGSGSGVFDAAVDAGSGKWAIGVDSDQYVSATKTQRKQILTSMLKRVDVATYNMISSVKDNKPLTSYTVYDLAHNGVGYATSGGYVDDIKSVIDGYAAKIKSGAIKVPTVPGKTQ
jgi:basic membrane protein A and related proteins